VIAIGCVSLVSFNIKPTGLAAAISIFLERLLLSSNDVPPKIASPANVAPELSSIS